MSDPRINRTSGLVVLGLSLFAMCLVVGATILAMLGRFNPSADGDEGTAAHLFQLAIVLLVPAGLAFLATADWQQPGQVAKRLIVPASALVVAFSTLYYMEHAEPPAAPAQPVPLYLGQSVPGLTPQLFAPGLVSTEAIELNSVFSRDWREFYFTRLVGGVDTDTIHQIVFADGAWGKPRELLLFPNGTRVESADMFLSADGSELYFLARYPLAGTGGKPNYDIWVSRRAQGDWSMATLVGPPISTAANELYPVLAGDGSLYFSSDRDADDAIYRAQRRPDGSFDTPVKLGPTINGGHSGDMAVAPDESYLLMTPVLPGGYGRGDVHVSFRRPDGSWGALVNLGNTINTEHHEWCPMVTPDGKYVFFSRWAGTTWEHATGGDVYWVDARVLEQFRSKSIGAN